MIIHCGGNQRRALRLNLVSRDYNGAGRSAKMSLPRAVLCDPRISYWTAAVLLRKLNSEARGRIEGRKETKLIEKTVERTEADDTPAPQDEPSIVDMPISRLDPASDTDATIARRERRARRASSAAEPLDFNAKRERRARRASAAAEPSSMQSQPLLTSQIQTAHRRRSRHNRRTARQARLQLKN